MTADGYDELERELGVDDWLVDCPDCGDTVTRSKINLHRARNTLCRWKRAGAEVRALWDADWRDPFTVPGAPLNWEGLQAKIAWRRRTRTIEFPRWVSVLLSPGTGPISNVPEPGHPFRATTSRSTRSFGGRQD